MVVPNASGDVQNLPDRSALKCKTKSEMGRRVDGREGGIPFLGFRPPCSKGVAWIHHPEKHRSSMRARDKENSRMCERERKRDFVIRLFKNDGPRAGGEGR